MEYLPIANRVQQGDLAEPTITAAGKHVIIIGGGDTGADCLGTAHRQGAASVTQLEILPQPPGSRAAITPWPTWPLMMRTSSAHEEGGERKFAVNTEEFLADDAGNVRALRVVEVRDDRRTRSRRSPARRLRFRPNSCCSRWDSSALNARWPSSSELDLDSRGNLARNSSYASNVPGVFVAGDAGRGQSLIVWAIAEGRAAASAVDHFLTGVERFRCRLLRPCPIKFTRAEHRPFDGLPTVTATGRVPRQTQSNCPP